MIPVGTASLLFGVHQFIVHPITVALAWRMLYGAWPTWREYFCMVVHDWGYAGRRNMDGAEGERHVELGARIAGRLLGPQYYFLCLFHSRHYAHRFGAEPSKLCWADKASILFERWWTYLPRAILSGELKEYRENWAYAHQLPLDVPNRTWFSQLQGFFRDIAQNQDAKAYLIAPNRHA